ncbi:MAG: hypothetical protein DWI21_12700 [Planctomycetota bacterium]|nr:MAG: hypothetical protein DWI21_12700 [Planctomycetota bacterium]GDY09810.1 hypothetical protein LBMAG52_32960 [Planctomycetia bacterium]
MCRSNSSESNSSFDGIDGVAAGKYQATAIPQTVIIDREGKVARLFVGGGPKLADQLRDALQSVLSGSDAAKPQ